MRKARLVIILFFFSTPFPLLFAASSPQDTRSAARARLDDNAADFRALFNLGYASYLLNDYEAALKQFKNALPQATSRRERSMVRYNMGNALFMQKKIKESLQQYRIGLRLNPDDRQLQYNYTVARLLRSSRQDNKNKQKNKNKNSKNGKKKKDSQRQKQGSDPNQQQKQKAASGKRGKMTKEDAKRILEALRQREGKRMKARQLKRPAGSKPSSKQW